MRAIAQSLVEDATLAPRPLRRPRPTIYAGGESPAAKALIAQKCDAWLTQDDPPETIGAKVADMRERRERLGLAPMHFGAAGYAVVRGTEAAARVEVARITQRAAERAGLRQLPGLDQ